MGNTTFIHGYEIFSSGLPYFQTRSNADAAYRSVSQELFNKLPFCENPLTNPTNQFGKLLN
ncbi:MAG: hypothetical protein Fur006_53580 [Coleofasciculaceae cyanobacterium]